MNCSYNITVLSSVLPPVLGVAFTLGAVGNAFALWIFCFHLRPWRSSTVLLFSLALADVLLLVALPFRISYYSSNFEWKFGNTFCSICYLLASMNRTGSTLFLIVIALDRYMHVVHPHNPVNFMSVSKSVCGAVILWLLTVMVSTFFTLYKSKKSYCGDFRSRYYSSNFEWKFGNTFCSICHFLVSTNRTGSTLFLIVIALDRYMRVVHPHHPVNFMSVSKSVCGAVILWLLTVMLGAFFTLYKSNKGYCGDFRSQCERNQTMSGHRLAYLLAFYVPFLVILFSTTSIVQHLRRRRIAQHTQVKKALLVLISIIILFVVCFLPSNITQLVIWSKVRTMATWGCAEMEQMTIIYTLTVSLTYLNSAMDPVVYFFSSSEFRSRCRRALGLKPSLDSTEGGEASTQPESQ
ncbi:hypothetical protein NL108_017844 [Boleophthalmus pectinirostris]|nr:hypothetical protein NL108_017844 [Boleophthalmus pectinirostris]